MSGWIKLHRKITESNMYKALNSKQRDVMFACLLSANFSENQWEFDGEIHKCDPGQFVSSLDSLCKLCGKDVKVQSVRTALLKLEKWGFLTNESTKTGRLVTICNWDTYQDLEIKPNKATNKDLTKNQQSTNKDLTPNNKDKESKEGKESKEYKGDKPPASFSFKQSLIDLGVEEDNAKDFLRHRNKAQAASTKKAFNNIKSQFDKSGLSANECIEICLGYKMRTGKVWTGFKAEWLKNIHNNGQYQESTQQPTISKTQDAAIGLAKRMAETHYKETGERIPYERFISGNS